MLPLATKNGGERKQGAMDGPGLMKYYRGRKWKSMGTGLRPQAGYGWLVDDELFYTAEDQGIGRLSAIWALSKRYIAGLLQA